MEIVETKIQFLKFLEDIEYLFCIITTKGVSLFLLYRGNLKIVWIWQSPAEQGQLLQERHLPLVLSLNVSQIKQQWAEL